MPDFASLEYWDKRFSEHTAPFDWLVPASALCTIVKDWTKKSELQQAEILHIGCGTSDSHFLCSLVDDAQQIHNVDYSHAAISAASDREREVLAKNSSTGEDIPATMRWSSLDLLSLEATLSLLDQQVPRGKLYDVILDKSTSDSISCGADVALELPYALSINGWTRNIMGTGVTHTGHVHPLHVLAVHLATVTAPSTGRWLCVSYSEDRFPFLPPYPPSHSKGLLTDDVVKAGFPHPRQLWRLEAKERINLEPSHEETLAARKMRLAAGTVHRPQVSHWLYVLVRTDAVVTD